MSDAAPSSSGQVSVVRRGGVATLRFANPPGGCIANKGAAELAAALATLLDDDGVRAIVLTGGRDGVFIRHADVGQIVRAGEALIDGRIDPRAFADSPFVRLGRILDRATKPVIAAIDGVCMGGGFEIALACTIRIAGTGVAAIGLPEIRIGIFPGGGGTRRLARIMGRSRARAFMLKGSVVDAAEAHRLGLIDEVAPVAYDRALALATELAGREPAALAAIMRLTQPDDDTDALEREAIAFATLLRDTPAAMAALRHFVSHDDPIEKRL